MVSRRTVLKTVGSALFSPTVILRDDFHRERLLRPFCDNDIYKYDLSEPFNVGALTYATDGRSIVRCELVSTINDGIDKKRPDVEQVYETLFKPRSEFVPLELPAIESLKMHDWGCPVCFSRRLPAGDFRDVYHYSKYDYDPDDETIADTSCLWCHRSDGEPRKEFPSLVVMGGGSHRVLYAHLLKIAAIPNVRIALSIACHDRDMPLLLFRGDGFQGIAACMRV